jgi:hypothetical protein
MTFLAPNIGHGCATYAAKTMTQPIWRATVGVQQMANADACQSPQQKPSQAAPVLI